MFDCCYGFKPLDWFSLLPSISISNICLHVQALLTDTELIVPEVQSKMILVVAYWKGYVRNGKMSLSSKYSRLILVINSGDKASTDTRSITKILN